jgi:catechol 2,3-dioxygenase-like lactoylglutathione lyase family enzyme
MRIADVRLTSADVDGAARFYETVLGLPVVSAPGTVS